MCVPKMALIKKIREYYEREALELKNHQKEMYFGNPWNTYWHGTRLREILRMAKTISFNSFLDVGCAEGYHIKLLEKLANRAKNEGLYIVGVDIARNYLLKAKKRCNGLLVVGDAHKLPFKENSFELVLCSEVLEHVLHPQQAFKELVRTSRKFILLTVAGENLFYYFTKKLGLAKVKDPFTKIGHGHIHEARIAETIIPWALGAECEPVESIVTCYFPLAFLQKHKTPTFFISVIKFVDKIINKLPVLRELGAVQIVLLQKKKAYNFK